MFLSKKEIRKKRFLRFLRCVGCFCALALIELFTILFCIYFS